jgi:hypothetical protein
MPRTRPNFIIPGAGKSGTNSLRSYLNEHPQVYFCRAKEPNYFAHAYDLGDDWYEGLFGGAGAAAAAATGEASTHYFWYPESASRIHAYNPDMRLVFSLRDPVRRAYSDYTAKLSRAGEALSFREVVDSDTTLLAHSRYHTNLKRYLDVFPMEQIHVIVFDDFIADRNAVLAGICEFLGVDVSFKFSSIDRRENRSQMPIFAPLQRFRMRFFAANNHDGAPKFYAKAAIRRGIDIANHMVETRGIPPMPKDDQVYVAGLLADEINGLEALIQRDLSHWKTVTTDQVKG